MQNWSTKDKQLRKTKCANCFDAAPTRHTIIADTIVRLDSATVTQQSVAKMRKHKKRVISDKRAR